MRDDGGEFFFFRYRLKEVGQIDLSGLWVVDANEDRAYYLKLGFNGWVEMFDEAGRRTQKKDFEFSCPSSRKGRMEERWRVEKRARQQYMKSAELFSSNLRRFNWRSAYFLSL